MPEIVFDKFIILEQFNILCKYYNKIYTHPTSV